MNSADNFTSFEKSCPQHKTLLPFVPILEQRRLADIPTQHECPNTSEIERPIIIHNFQFIKRSWLVSNHIMGFRLAEAQLCKPHGAISTFCALLQTLPDLDLSIKHYRFPLSIQQLTSYPALNYKKANSGIIAVTIGDNTVNPLFSTM